MPNIQFNYLYRDGGNYKNYSFIIFENSLSISMEELETLIKSKLIYGEWFYAEEWKLPELFTDFIDFKTDPTWHEFESVEYTDEAANSTLRLGEFLRVIQQTKRVY